MSRRRNPASLFCLIVIGGLISAARAEPPAAKTAADAELTRLETLADAQQARIEQLEATLTAAAAHPQEADRTAQMKAQIREVLSDSAFRESLLPPTTQAGYQWGFYIRSSDDKFTMLANVLLQFRWTHYATRSENRYLAPGFRRSDHTGFDLARARFRLYGNVYSKDLTYFLLLDMSAPGGYDAQLRYAWVNYRFADEFQTGAGVFRMASTRADASWAGGMPMTEYPMSNALFGLWRGVGVRFWGSLLKGRGEYYLDIVNSLSEAYPRTIVNDEDLYALGHDNNPAVVFRTLWDVLGEQVAHKDDDAHFSDPCDLAFHEEPALNIGGHYAFNEDRHDGLTPVPYARRTFFRKGGFGVTNSDGLQLHQIGLDAGFKYRGFSATAEYVVRVLDVREAARAPFSPLFLATGDSSTSVQHGGYLQCGYFLPIPGLERKLEMVGRLEGITINTGGHEGTWIYSGGLNYYIDGHRVKLQTDVTKISEVPLASPSYSLANVNDDALIWRVQLQLVF